MTIKQFVCSCALPVVLLPLLSCVGSQHAGDEKYYFVASNVKLPYWETAKNGFMRGISSMKVKGEFVGPETYDPAEQQKQFQQIVKAKPAGILLSAADASLLKGDIDAAIAAGIPVVTVDSDSPGSKRLFFVGTNNYEAGRMGGRRLAEILKGKGNVAVYTMPGQANLDERLKGYKDALSDHSGVKIVEVIDFRGDPRLAFDKTQELLGNKKEQIDAFVCLEASAGQEVAEVINRAKATDKTIMAFDTNEDTLKWIQQGLIAATIAQKPWTMSYVGLQMLDQVHHSPPKTLDGNFGQDPFSVLPDFVDTGATLIDKSNVASFLQARESSKAQ
jgi:ribose transport system substrate-binding protein